MKKVITLLTWPIRKLLLFLIVGLRPLLGPAYCKLTPSCTNYAMETLNTQPLLKAIWLICKRLVKCFWPR